MFVAGLDLTFELRVDEDDLSVNRRQRSKLSVKDCGNSGFVNRSKLRVSFILTFSFLVWMHEKQCFD